MEEKKLLVKRDAAEQKDYHHAAHLLIEPAYWLPAIGHCELCWPAVKWNVAAKQKPKQRGLIDELQKLSLKSKTLSGLIPICAWVQERPQRQRLLVSG